ncbi:MAG: hypothetical protein NTX82_05830 [Candidatus Parcubacteria bacterium]|nr:hypothetical protein [Candidatus Parcubacteria bacterium]
MEAVKFVMNNQEPRDFSLLDQETQALASAVCGHKVTGMNVHLAHLAKNLRKSETIVWATKRVMKSEAIGINWEHLLNYVVEDCLKPFHEETYWHLKRMHRIMTEQFKLLEHQKPEQLDDFGCQDFRTMEHFELTSSDQQNLKWAAAFHDLGRMCYPVSFWNTKGAFSLKQRKQLDFHARNFYFLGEMLNVYQEVIALSVLHHWPNKGYPDNGIIARLRPFLDQPKFQYTLNWLVTNDVYGGATDRRSYRDHAWSHEQVIIETMPKEMARVGLGWVPFIQALKQPGQGVVCPA